MRVIGLTGTIGAGKSTVARWLAQLGAAAIDADEVAHEVYESDTCLRLRIRERFGPDVLIGDRIHRQALVQVVLHQPGALADLEALVHPLVYERIRARSGEACSSGAQALVLEAIKLVESRISRLCDECWIVTADQPIQLARLEARGVRPVDALRWLAVQGSISTWIGAFRQESAVLRRPRPIVILDNSGPEEEGRAQAERFYTGVCEAAHSGHLRPA